MLCSFTLGIGMILFSKFFNSFQTLSNNSIIIGPFHEDSVLSCAGSSPDSSNFHIFWFTSNTNYNVPLPTDPMTNMPILPPIGSYASANGTLLNINLGIFFQSPDFEAVYQCIAQDNTFTSEGLFIHIYSRPPSLLYIFVF